MHECARCADPSSRMELPHAATCQSPPSSPSSSDCICYSTRLVSAFVDANHIVFSRLAVEDKSNEIDAIPRLLSLLDLSGATVTIDAIGCQKEIARQIVEAEGDYVQAVKENQKALHEKVKTLLDDAILGRFEGMAQTSSNRLTAIMAA
jgi:predicted transposase YbfD/YdcC